MNVSQMVQLGKMLDIYGSMLTEKQFKILNINLYLFINIL